MGIADRHLIDREAQGPFRHVFVYYGIGGDPAAVRQADSR